MKPIEKYIEFLLLGLLTVLPLIILLDIIDHKIIASVLQQQYLLSIYVLPLAYIVGIIMHVYARLSFNWIENRVKKKLWEKYRKDIADEELLRFLSGDPSDISFDTTDSVKEAFRRMRRFIVSHVSPTILDKPRVVLRSIRGSIIPFLFLAIVSFLWGIKRGNSFGYGLSLIAFFLSLSATIAFCNRSRKYERQCISAFIVNLPLAKEILCGKKAFSDKNL